MTARFAFVAAWTTFALAAMPSHADTPKPNGIQQPMVRNDSQRPPPVAQGATPRLPLTAEQRLELKRLEEGDGQVFLLTREKKFREAIDLGTRVLEGYTNILGSKHVSPAKSLNRLGEVYEAMGDYAQAESFFLRSLKVYESVRGKDHPDTAWEMRNLGSMYRSKGDFAKAEPLLMRALAIHEKSNGQDDDWTVESVIELARLHADLGNYSKCVPLYERVLIAKEKKLGPKHRSIADLLGALGLTHKRLGNYEQAEAYYLRALEMKSATIGAEHRETAKTLDNLAQLYMSLRDYAKAEPLSRRALRIRQETLGREHPETAFSLNGLAALYEETGDAAKAEPLYVEALKIREKVLGPEHPDTATSLHNLAFVCRELGAHREAQVYAQRACEIREKRLGPNHPLTASSLISLATSYKHFGDTEKASEALLRAVQIQERTLGAGHVETASGLTALALVQERLGDNVEAERLHLLSLEIREKALGPDHPSTAASLNNLAALRSRLGRHAEAEQLARRGLSSVRLHLDRTAAVQSERQRFLMEESFRSRLSAWLSVSLAAKVAPAETYAEILAWKGAVTCAQHRQRFLRLTAEKQGGADAQRDMSQWEQVSRQLAWRTLAGRRPTETKVAYEAALLELSERKEEIERRLAQHSAARHSALLTPPLPVALARCLPRGAALVDLLQYSHSLPSRTKPGEWVFERRLLAFVLRNEGENRDPMVEMIGLGPVTPLSDAIEQWRAHLSGNPEGRAAGRKLRTDLWDRLAPHLAQAKQVLVSLDGPLCRLPLAALPGKREGTYLIEEGFQFAMLPVPRLLPEMLASNALASDEVSLLALGEVAYDAAPGVPSQPGMEPTPPGTLAQPAPLGNPLAANLPVTRSAPHDEQNRNWKPLPATGREVESVAAIFRKSQPQGEARVLRGEVTTEAQLRTLSTRARYLHLATHGYFDEARLARSAEAAQASRDRGDFSSEHEIVGFHPDLLCGLVFAGANRPANDGHDDGILTATEVAALDLRHTELAVLSACETGLGQRHTGEGLLGLQRAFQVAGAKNVVASLWKVDDAATQVLMTEFYTNLWQKKMPPIEALRQAQLKMLVAYQPTAGKLRAGFEDQALDEAALAAARAKLKPGEGPLPPFYWAAFVLSGTGR